ncbi:hypothetical protein F5Y15DRAFT_280905 [Xylariaceae sp. FL0016]|nr:hypothetical protein F5Y15DRAFT_280905 [Xylariaceae sp. FL0016]
MYIWGPFRRPSVTRPRPACSQLFSRRLHAISRYRGCTCNRPGSSNRPSSCAPRPTASSYCPPTTSLRATPLPSCSPALLYLFFVPSRRCLSLPRVNLRVQVGSVSHRLGPSHRPLSCSACSYTSLIPSTEPPDSRAWHQFTITFISPYSIPRNGHRVSDLQSFF